MTSSHGEEGPFHCSTSTASQFPRESTLIEKATRVVGPVSGSLSKNDEISWMSHDT